MIKSNQITTVFQVSTFSRCCFALFWCLALWNWHWLWFWWWRWIWFKIRSPFKYDFQKKNPTFSTSNHTGHRQQNSQFLTKGTSAPSGGKSSLNSNGGGVFFLITTGSGSTKGCAAPSTAGGIGCPSSPNCTGAAPSIGCPSGPTGISPGAASIFWFFFYYLLSISIFYGSWQTFPNI